MIHIKVTDTNGKARELELKPSRNTSLMEVLTRENFDVPAICGGMAGCGTCHIKVTKGFDQLDGLEDDELFMIESLPNAEDTSRLSCQVMVTDAIDGLEVVVLGDS